MRLYISNAFSLSMLDRNQQKGHPNGYTPSSRPGQMARLPRPVDDPVRIVREWGEAGAEIISALGHPSTQKIMEDALGISVPVNRICLTLEDPSTHVLVGQYIGPRLPEGATELPEGAILEWWIV